MRVSSVTSPSSMGTLKSTRTSTRLPARSAPSISCSTVRSMRGSEVLGHQLEHVDHAAREAVLVVVPDEELGHAAHGAGQLAVDDGRVRVADDVGGDDRVGGEAHHALEAALGGAFDAGVDLVGR